jgi:hypothetical protein
VVGCGSESSVYLHLHNKCGAQQHMHSQGIYLGVHIVDNKKEKGKDPNQLVLYCRLDKKIFTCTGCTLAQPV